MTRCAVRNCKSGTFSNNAYNVQNNIRPPTLFAVPKSPAALSKWEAALNQELPPKSRVCELHFADADVKRTDDTLLPDGSLFRLPRQKYSLCKTAVPKDVMNQENKAPGKEQACIDENDKDNHQIDPTVSNRLQLLDVDKVVTTPSANGTDTFLNDHQYYIDTNKPGQYCYYNKKVAACFTIPSLLHDLKKIGEMASQKLEDQDEIELKDEPSTMLHSESDSEPSSLTIESIINYLQKNPIRRAWSWMKFTKKDMGITFTQIHFRTRKVRCYIELHEDFSILIQTGDEQISLEIEFEITSIDHVLDLLATVEKMKICTGTGYDHESRAKNCTGIIPVDEEYKIAILCDRCVACRVLRKQVRIRKNCNRDNVKVKYEKVKKEVDALRRKCKYYESRLTLKNKRLKIIKEMIRTHNKNLRAASHFNGRDT